GSDRHGERGGRVRAVDSGSNLRGERRGNLASLSHLPNDLARGVDSRRPQLHLELAWHVPLYPRLLGDDLSQPAVDRWNQFSNTANQFQWAFCGHGGSTHFHLLADIAQRIRSQLYDRSHQPDTGRSLAAASQYDLRGVPQWGRRENRRHRSCQRTVWRYRRRSRLYPQRPAEFYTYLHLPRQCDQGCRYPQFAVRCLLHSRPEERNSAAWGFNQRSVDF